MVPSEHEMIRRTTVEPDEAVVHERSTSLQPTYEDSIPPEEDWEFEQD